MIRTREPGSALTIPWRSAGMLTGLILVFVVAGSLRDLEISQSLYTSENMFGVVLAGYGEAPALLALVAAGTLAITARPPVHMVLRWALIVGGAALIVVGAVALIVRPEEYWPLPVAVRGIISLALSSATIWATIRVSRESAWQAMCALAAALFAVVAIEMVLVQGVKILWERPRMRMLEETGASFAPWWSPGYPEKTELLARGVESSEFKSFPSGHAANAGVTMMLIGFALLREDLRRHTATLFWIGAGWALLVSFSRITVGAHFLTDTAAGLLLSLAAVIVVALAARWLLASGLLDRLAGPEPDPGPAARHGRPAP